MGRRAFVTSTAPDGASRTPPVTLAKPGASVSGQSVTAQGDLAPATTHRHARRSSGAERRNWVPDPGCRIVACVDIETVGVASADSLRSGVLRELAVRRLERCVRPSDWMCMLGGNRVGILFGNGGHRVAPSVLGCRLAQAMGDHLSVGADDLDVHVAVGISAGPSAIDPADLTSSALAAIRSTRDRTPTSLSGPRAMVTVSHVPANAVGLPRPARRGAAEATPNVTGARLVRRVLVPLRSPTTGPDENDHTREQVDVAARQALGTVPRVLMIDPSGTPSSIPRIAVEAAAAMARRVGARTTISHSADPERVLLELYVSEPHAAVVVVQNDTFRSASPDGSTRSWDSVLRMIRVLHDSGTPIIAVSIGASAALIASCIEQGAIGLLNPDDLPHELTALFLASGNRKNGSNGSNGNGKAPEGFSRRLPGPCADLVVLTPSERRILFHMMEGRSAAEIAEELVVSLPTVRSHIRSILRKLKVNSQLAAVAIANGMLRQDAMSS